MFISRPMARGRAAAMALVSLLGLGAVAFALPAAAVLPIGATAPTFSTQAALAGQEQSFSLSEALKQGPVVLYFYPAAFTQGCTIEAHAFADATEQFQALGARVIGVSADNIETLKRFSVSACQSRFAVAADSDRRIMQSYDATLAIRPDLANRVSYVITPDGKILFEYTSLNPDGHVDNTLKALRAWVDRSADGAAGKQPKSPGAQ